MGNNKIVNQIVIYDTEKCIAIHVNETNKFFVSRDGVNWGLLPDNIEDPDIIKVKNRVLEEMKKNGKRI